MRDDIDRRLLDAAGLIPSAVIFVETDLRGIGPEEGALCEQGRKAGHPSFQICIDLIRPSVQVSIGDRPFLQSIPAAREAIRILRTRIIDREDLQKSIWRFPAAVHPSAPLSQGV